MEQKDSKIFNKTIMQSVSSFCDANNIEDKDNFIYLCFKQGFDIKKFGLLGETLNEGEKDLKTVEIEEIRVEVPVEVIREVEKIVTKIEYICDKSGESELFGKIKQLEEEMSKKDEKLDELRRNLDIILDITLDEPPVEIIKEVEKIVEVIKEVEKPNDRVEMLQETLISLRKELQTKNERIKELEKINRDLENLSSNKGAVFLRGSNLNNRI
jgi:DNA repair exonuclease SbcCD ATPase subunit|tara:strand:+ start:897 stop:1535 length:639 start_codon:yes stop_codon:yes gene_type:complete